MHANPADWVDLDRYPILSPEHPEFHCLCDQARTELNTQSVMVLPNFIRDDALQQMRREGAGLAPHAHHMEVTVPLFPEGSSSRSHDAYHATPFEPTSRFRTSVRAVSYHHIPLDALIRRLYEWDPLMTFIGSLLDVAPLYRYRDPYGALNLAVMSEGDEFGWHYDQTDFVVSLVLQEPDAGGAFRCYSASKSSPNAQDDSGQSPLERLRDRTSTVPMTMGSMILFKGRETLHSVTPILGQTPRIVALLAYDTKPGTVCSPALIKARYGVDISADT